MRKPSYFGSSYNKLCHKKCQTMLMTISPKIVMPNEHIVWQTDDRASLCFVSKKIFFAKNNPKGQH